MLLIRKLVTFGIINNLGTSITDFIIFKDRKLLANN